MGWQNDPVVENWQSDPVADAIPGKRPLTAAAAIPFISEDARQQIDQLLREARGGATQALMSPLQLAGASKLGLLPERGKATNEYIRQTYGVDPESFGTKAGRLGAEVVLGSPVIKGTGALLERVSPALGQTVKTGGFEVPAGVEGARKIGLMAAGGGIAGTASVLPFNPEDAVFGGGLGMVLAPAGRAVFGGLRDVFNMARYAPREIAENALLSVGGPELLNALNATRNLKTTPGYTPSVGERAAEGGLDNIALAALQDRLSRAPKAAQIQFDSIQKNMGYLQGQLARVEQELGQDITRLAPGDASRLTEVRNNLQRQLATEEQNFNALMTSLRGELPPNVAAAPGQSPGEVIQTRARDLQRKMRAEEVQPAYANAFKAAGDTALDVSPLAAAAQQALGRPLAEFAPESAPAVARVLARLEPRPIVETRVSARGRPQRVVTGETPPTMTLQELDDLRQAINSDIQAAKMSQSGLTPRQQGPLNALHAQIDDIIRNAPNLSDEAKQLYNTALETYRFRFAPAFKSPVTGRLLQDSAFGETRIMPADTVAAYFGGEAPTRQFFTTFGQDPQARAAFATGVEDLFRQKAVDNVTRRLNPDAAAAFLEQNAPKLQILEEAGIPIRQKLERIQTEAARITQGLDEVGQLRTVFGKETTQDVVQSLLSSPTDMRAALQRLSPDGKEAVQASVVQRIKNMLTGDSPDVGAAVKLLVDSEQSIKQVLGKEGFADLNDLVKRAGQVSQVSKDLAAALPQARVQPRIQQLALNMSPAEKADLATLAADIARFQRAEGLSAAGAAASRPAAERLGSEAAQQVGTAIPRDPLNAMTNLAMRLSRQLERRINDKTANELAVLMYQHPNEAIAALEKAMWRKEAQAMYSAMTGRKTVTAGVKAVQPYVDFREQQP